METCGASYVDTHSHAGILTRHVRADFSSYNVDQLRILLLTICTSMKDSPKRVRGID